MHSSSNNFNFKPKDLVYCFSQAAIETINGVNAFDYLAINNTGSTVRITANTAVSNRLRLTNGTLDLISPPSFTLTMSDGSEIYRTASNRKHVQINNV